MYLWVSNGDLRFFFLCFLIKGELKSGNGESVFCVLNTQGSQAVELVGRDDEIR